MRACGECTLCCYFLRIPETDSAEYSLCKHCDGGCTIYDERPAQCCNFECLWLRQPQIPEALRPDKCGVMFELPDACATYVGHIVPGNDGFKRPEIGVLVRKINAAGNAVMLYDNSTGDQYLCAPSGMTIEDVRNDIGRALDAYNARAA